MSETSSMEEILNKAKEEEGRYEWLKAADCYRKALTAVAETDFLRKGELSENLAYAVYRTAFQAEKTDEFRARIERAVEEYEKAKHRYEKEGEYKIGEALRCDAMIAYMGYWLAFQVSEKKTLLARCWEFAGEALEAFEESENALDYGKTYNRLSSVAFLEYSYEWDFKAREKVIQQAMDWGEKTIALLSNAGKPKELARACVKVAFYQTVFGLFFVADTDKRESHRQNGQDRWQEAERISEKDAYLELAATLGGCGDEMGWSVDEIQVNFEKALEFAKETKDKYLIGTALDWLAYATQWKSYLPEDPIERIELEEKAQRYAHEAREEFSLISLKSPRGDQIWVEAPRYEYFFARAVTETDLKRRREAWEEAVEHGNQALKLALDSGYPGIIYHIHQILGEAHRRLAQMQTDPGRKRILLEKAVEHQKQSLRILDELYSLAYWNRGTALTFLSTSQAEMAKIERDPVNQMKMLEEAIRNINHGLQLCAIDVAGFEKRGDFTVDVYYGIYRYYHGKMLADLYGLTKVNKHLRAGIEAFEKAAESLQKVGKFSRVAECYWNVARNYDILGDHLKAVENFGMASNNYKTASDKIPQLKEFFGGYVFYMQAWTEIERGRYHHGRQEYGVAEERFRKAAELHDSSKHWSYLSPSYAAWAKVEYAEELSRKQQDEEALASFQQSAELFEKAKRTIRAAIDKIVDSDEKEMATRMLDASENRRQYCRARIAIEKAKILDRESEHVSSAREYGLAVEILEKTGQTLESESDRREFQFIACLSRAWQKMAEAEADESPEYYDEASQLFEKAKDMAESEKTKALVLGHSRFCKALETGARFVDARDYALHSSAKEYLESASNHYLKAGFLNASEYARATGLLFDAYMYMRNASKEIDPEKKTKLLIMTERVLQTCAASYTKAEYPTKKRRVLCLLEKVKEEKELAISLTEVFNAPIISSTTAFAAPAPTEEKAVGLERFEHADVRANLSTSQPELEVGGDLELKIELANAGKGSALLVRVEEVVPEGLDLSEGSGIYALEDNCLDLKGRRLDPLKTDEIRLVLKSYAGGVFELRPRIVYMDEIGNQAVFKPDPLTVKVTEVKLPNRVATGSKFLDNLMLGGIPENYVIMLSSSSCDERDMLIRSFLGTGAKNGEVTFYVTMTPSAARTLAEEFQSNFHLFVCNPHADTIVKNAPNMVKLKGVENLTEISIALTSAIHKLDPTLKGPRRICIELVSDVLLQHHAVQTRKWLTALTVELKSNGFTALATVDPQMHPPEELHAILGLFDGEINIYEKGTEQFLKIKRMSNQKYLEIELPLSRALG